jgi:hypothetical protein
VEVVQGLNEAKLDKVPELFEKSRTKTVRAGARVIIHGEKSSADFLKGERPNKGVSLGLI